MSETDDTDVLLLIPPDFFLVRSSGSEDSLLESSRTVVHKPPSCTAQVIGKLVDQVQTLETRLETLEISTTITDSSLCTLPRRKNWDTDSIDSRSFDSKYFTFPRRRRRKVIRKQKHHDVSLTSFDSISSRKIIPSLKLKEFELVSVDSKSQSIHDSPSMEGDISSIVSTPNKKNDKLLLNEIDEFLTKVEAYETPDAKYNDIEASFTPDSVIKATGDYFTQRLDNKNDDIKLPSGRIVSSTVLDKYIYLVKSNPQSATHNEKAVPSTSAYHRQYNVETHSDHHTVPSTSAYQRQYHEETSTNHPPLPSTDTPKAVEGSKNATDTKSPSIRRLNFEKEVQPTSTPKKPQTSSYLDTFKPSSNKIYDRASKVLEQYKLQNYSRNQNVQSSMTDSYASKEEFKLPQMRPFVFETKEGLTTKFLESIDTELLSLSDLWGEKVDKEDRGRGDSSKLEEERLKREHCESIIQQLQKKILDQQEKLAVAIRVDRAKDHAIAKLRDAWVKLTSSLDKAEERHRAALERMLREVENFKHVACEAQKKTNHFEAELYKALDLAHDYQDKCKQLTAKTKDTQDSTERLVASKDDVIHRKDKEIEALKENYETVMRLNKQSTDCVKNLEDALEKEKSDHEQTKAKLAELHHKVQCHDDETLLVRQERDLLKEKVNEERGRSNMLEIQLSDKQDQNSELLRKCETLDSEIKTLRKHLELQKNELKSHYQKQLEEAVLAKLQEFQQQLELAEREMESEARGKENAIVDTFNKQMARIEEQHKLEINVLEEKQFEEIKLFRLQLAQASEKNSLLEQKLESYRRRRGQIAAQLHGVMETQWRQALLILTHGARPDGTGIERACTPAPPPLRAQRDDHSFNFEGLSDSELQQYVKLLLTKPPNLDGSGDGRPPDLNEEPTSDRPEKERKAKRSLSGSKPPWKA